MLNGVYFKLVLVLFAVTVGIIVGKLFFSNSNFLKASIVEYEPVNIEQNMLEESSKYEITPKNIGEYVEENAAATIDENGNIYFLDK